MEQVKRIWQHVNPRNSLFGRIFVWFWLAVIVMIMTVFTVTRYSGQTWQVSALPDAQLARATVIYENVKASNERGVDIQRLLRRVSSRGRLHLLAINLDNKDIIFGFPPLLVNQREKFFDLAESHSPVMLRTNNMEFSGPFPMAINGQEYHLFIGRLLPRTQRPFFVIGTSLVLIILLGTLACAAIAWTIAQPIKRLRVLSEKFASGEEQSPDIKLLARGDELGLLHNDIYAMASKLAKSLAQQKALMANISHELRTPLTRLQLCAAMLESNESINAKYVMRIEKEIKVMDSLIAQAIQLAKLDDQQTPLSQKQDLPMPSFISPLLDDLRFEAKATKIVFNVQECPQVYASINTTSMHSAIENVTRNAFKYAKSKVSLEFEVLLKDAQKWLRISIQDDGEGLPLGQYEQIFQPFYRAHSGQEFMGTGLGLSIAKAAIELHNGHINATASPLGGLQVNLTLPLLESKPC